MPDTFIIEPANLPMLEFLMECAVAESLADSEKMDSINFDYADLMGLKDILTEAVAEDGSKKVEVTAQTVAEMATLISEVSKGADDDKRN